MPFGLMLWAFPFSFAQPLFPARGFSEILSDTEAQAKVDAFKQVYFPTHKEKRHHQAFVYRVHFLSLIHI